MKLPSRVKNPRKMKKAWRRQIVANLTQAHGRNGIDGNPRWRLHWVPGDGWTVDVSKKYRGGVNLC